MPPQRGDIRHDFLPHELNAGQMMAVERVQLAAVHFAETLFDVVPESADRSAAYRHILDAKMTAVLAIAKGF